MLPGATKGESEMSASVTHSDHQGDRYQQVRAELARQSYQHTVFALRLIAGVARRAATAVGQALMRWAAAYERTAQERIMRELARSHPSLLAEIRAARAGAAAEAARHSPVTGMWE